MYNPKSRPDSRSKVPSKPTCDDDSYPPGLSGQRGGPEPLPLHAVPQNPDRDASSGPQTLGGFSCAREQTCLSSDHFTLQRDYSAITGMDQVCGNVRSQQVIHVFVFAIEIVASSGLLPQLEADQFLN